MIFNDKKNTINRIIDYTHDKKIKWNFLERNDIKIEFYSKIKITNNKYIYLVITKRKVMRNYNFYLSIYAPLKKNMYTFDKLPDEIIIDDDEIQNGYNYINITNYYYSSYPELVRLYGEIKYKNLIFSGDDKMTFIENLTKWTDDNLLIWEKEGDNSYICYDTKVDKNELFIKVFSHYLSIIYHGKNYNIINLITNTNNNITKLIESIKKTL
jgi:hypothetical protein